MAKKAETTVSYDLCDTEKHHHPDGIPAKVKVTNTLKHSVHVTVKMTDYAGDVAETGYGNLKPGAQEEYPLLRGGYATYRVKVEFSWRDPEDGAKIIRHFILDTDKNRLDYKD